MHKILEKAKYLVSTFVNKFYDFFDNNSIFFMNASIEF